MPTVTLLRHGQASFGAADYDNLSELGHQQAGVAADTLADRGLRNPVVASGTLRRQRDTAAPVARRFGVDDIRVDPRWNEYDHVAMVEHAVTASGRSMPTGEREFQAVLDTALSRWVTDDAADGWRAFSGGAVAALEELVEGLEPGRDAVVATSGGVIAAIAAHLLRGGADTVVALNRVVVNAAFTTLLAGRSGLSLLGFNDHAHFTGERSGQRTYR
ncbi:Phosphoglycerate mutase family protein [Euzebya pacifica]|uniref:Phosphoglycerate mutase family protein n=1 Tax=Euzebya pacifica TaxID=1608957 RepID=A0A346Y0F7_9ACTN|nr:histidine phosphatase family protein [Euzebya pacifica]AXV07954.1 Phosphoglycerate mutase family protein [Euzebya pacifica]